MTARTALSISALFAFSAATFVGVDHIVSNAVEPGVVIIDNGLRGGFDVQSPTRLHVSGTEILECADMGGRWTGDTDATSGTLALCEDVDY